MREAVARFKHVLIDEIQDVVGDRVKLARAILQAVDGGFTAFGDPAQGIFTFAVTDGAATPWDLANWLRNEFGDELMEKALTKNMRVKSGSRTSSRGFALIQT